MTIKTLAGLMMAALLAACQASKPAAPTATETVAATAVASAPVTPVGTPAKSPPAPAPATGTPGTASGLPDDRTPLSEPTKPIDPKSAEAAGQVLQTYGALLEERKFGQARKLWGGGGAASGLSDAQFAAAYAKYRVIHAEVGKPGATEGAAGSIYVEIPFRLFGRLRTGEPFNLVGPMTLRRVNDVDGATPAQLRWHIGGSALKPRR